MSDGKRKEGCVEGKRRGGCQKERKSGKRMSRRTKVKKWWTPRRKEKRLRVPS